MRAALLGSALTVGACGGGGGGPSGPATQSSSPPPPVNYVTDEFRRNYGLGTIHADSAYAAGRTGAGVIVGLVDTGIDVNNPEFAGAIHAASRSAVTGLASDLQDQNGHGTAVAGVIRAARNGVGTHGVAYDTQLLVLRSDTPGSCATSCSFEQTALTTATNLARINGARVINYSLGGAAPSAAFSTALTQAADTAVLVAAAGNVSGANPIDPALSLALAGRGIAVGAVDSNNAIAAYSNRAGVAKDFYLVAPGTAITTVALGGGTAVWTGTSLAAPHVSAAAALLIQAYPYLSPAQVMDILLRSATDLGAAGVDTVYGHGLLNVQAAMGPLGTLSVPSGSSLGAGGSDVLSTTARLGPAFGDALGSASLLKRAVALDDYGRPFAVDLSGRIERPAPSPDIASWLRAGQNISGYAQRLANGGLVTLQIDSQDRRSFTDDARDETPASRVSMTGALRDGTGFGFSRGLGLDAAMAFSNVTTPVPGGMLSGGFASPYFAMASSGDSMAVGTAIGPIGLKFGASTKNASDQPDMDPSAVRVNAGEISYRLDSGASVAAQFGNMREHGSLLQSFGNGALGLGEGASTFFMTWSGSLPVTETWKLFGRYSAGATNPSELSSSLLRDFSSIRSNAFAAGLVGDNLLRGDDSLAFVVSQPLRVTHGAAQLDAPVGRAADGTIVRSSERVSLSPSGREIDAEVQYQLRLDAGESVLLNMMLQLQPGHEADARPGAVLGARYKLSL